MSLDWITNFFDKIIEPYEIQLEGGEPTIHPEYNKILNYFYHSPNCVKIVLTTNGTSFSTDVNVLRSYFENYTEKEFIIKPSINEYLIRKDKNLLETYQNLVNITKDFPNIKIIFNVRKRKNNTNDQELVDELIKRNLHEYSNIFFYQKYGKARKMEEYEEPFIIENPVDFHLMTPDGHDFGMDMIGRSEYMKNLK